MQLVVDLLKSNWRLSSPIVFLTLVGFGVLLLYVRRLAPWGRRWLVAVLLGFWFVATPIGSATLSAPLVRRYAPILSTDQAKEVQAIVILGGGIMTYYADGVAIDDVAGSALRVIEGVRLYRFLGGPLMFVSGGNTGHWNPARPEAHRFRDALLKLGVPASRIIVEDQSRTTREQGVIFKDLLASHHIDRFVLVTGGEHMTRSVAVFRAAGLAPIPSPARLRSEPAEAEPWPLMPDRESLNISDRAIYEYVALGYYRWRGWIGSIGLEWPF